MLFDIYSTFHHKYLLVDLTLYLMSFTIESKSQLRAMSMLKFGYSEERLQMGSLVGMKENLESQRI